ncbi:MAG TPA: hypothetical protein VEC37_08480 [Bacillota bacterium]|nr:hypothetical protein [Bacillota bacterium]
MDKAKNDPKEMNLLDEPAETDSGMLLSILADEPREAESAMFLNSLVDDPEALQQDAERLIRAVDKAEDRQVEENNF